MWLLAILLAGATLRLYHLDTESFWLDEAFSVSIAKTTLRHIVEETSLDVHPPLYYVLLYYWVHALGASEATARLLSTLFSLATVVATYGLGRRLFDTKSALAAAGLLACSRFQVEFSQEARMYALLALLGTGSTYCLVRVFELGPGGNPRRRRTWLSAYTVVAIAMTYTHAYSAFMLAAHGMMTVVEAARRGRPGWRLVELWLATQLGVVAAYLPWLSVFAWQFSLVQQGFWIPETRAFMVFWPLVTYPGSVPLALLLVPLTGWGLWKAAAVRGAPHASPRGVLLPWLICPIVLPLVLSFIGSPIFLPKYTIAAAVPFALLAGRGLVALPGPGPLIALSLLALLTVWKPLDTATSRVLDAVNPSAEVRRIFTGSTLTSYYTTKRKDGWRDAVWNIESAARPGDAVIFYPFFNQIPYDLYRRRTDLIEAPFPKHAALLTRTTVATMTREMVKPYRRVWFVVLQQEGVKPLLVAELEKVFPHVTRIREWHIDVYLCEADPPAASAPGALGSTR